MLGGGGKGGRGWQGLRVNKGNQASLEMHVHYQTNKCLPRVLQQVIVKSHLLPLVYFHCHCRTEALYILSLREVWDWMSGL